MYFVTGNKNKLKEFQEILNIPLKQKDLKIVEIQSLNIKEVALDKARKAYELVKAPVLVEDTSLELEALNGLPGVFVKYFDKLGKDAIPRLLCGRDNKNATIKTAIAYKDKDTEFVVTGELKGVIIEQPSKGEGWGFDFVFVPEGFNKTLAELGPETKNEISHRRIAIEKLKNKLGL